MIFILLTIVVLCIVVGFSFGCLYLVFSVDKAIVPRNSFWEREGKKK